MKKRKKNSSKKCSHYSKKRNKISKETIVVKTYYVAETDIVVWECLKDNKPITLTWAAKDFGPAMGINADIPRNMIVDFLPKMQGKKFNLVSKTIKTDEDVLKATEKVKEDNVIYHDYIEKTKWEI